VTQSLGGERAHPGDTAVSGVVLLRDLWQLSLFPSTRDARGACANGLKNPNDAGAGASDYLRLMGITVVALMWGKMAKASLAKGDQFHKDKLMCARYWMERMVPECPMLLERIQAGSAVVMELE